MKQLTLSLLPKKLGICHFDKDSAIPQWATESEFFSITKTGDELSIICLQEDIPGGVLSEKDWRAFKVEGPLGFSLTGIVSSLATPLANANISILYVSTYETDYLFVEERTFGRAVQILSEFCTIRQ